MRGGKCPGGCWARQVDLTPSEQLVHAAVRRTDYPEGGEKASPETSLFIKSYCPVRLIELGADNPADTTNAPSRLSDASHRMPPTALGFSPTNFVPPLGYQAWRLEVLEFLPFFELPFFFEFPPPNQPHQLQPAWFPWGERRPFFSKGFLECFSEHGVMSFPMCYPWGRLTPIFSSSFHQCFCQYVLSSSSWGRLASIFCSDFTSISVSML